MDPDADQRAGSGMLSVQPGALLREQCIVHRRVAVPPRSLRPRLDSCSREETRARCGLASFLTCVVRSSRR